MDISHTGDAAHGDMNLEYRGSLTCPTRFFLIFAASALRGATKAGARRMRFAMLAALAAWVGLAEPATALDKVKFATNSARRPRGGRLLSGRE